MIKLLFIAWFGCTAFMGGAVVAGYNEPNSLVRLHAVLTTVLCIAQILYILTMEKTNKALKKENEALRQVDMSLCDKNFADYRDERY